MKARWLVVLLVAVAACNGSADGGELTAAQLESGVEISWSGTGDSAGVCWERPDLGTGDCPMTLDLSSRQSPTDVTLDDFECPKCGDVDAGDLVGFLNSAIAEGENSKLIEWRLEWADDGETRSRMLVSSDPVQSPAGDNPFGAS